MAGSSDRQVRARNGPGAARVEIAVIGAGPAGLTAAIALASAGIETALVSKRPPRPDNRTTALLAGSVRALETLGVWDSCRDQAAPLEAIRIIDDTRRLIRAPEVVFHAAEIGLEAFGHNIENVHLVAALDSRAAGLPQLRRIEQAAAAIEPDAELVRVRLADGSRLEARLVVGADGRRSLCRAAAGILTDAFDYGQAALTLNLRHTRPHASVSTEFHTESGPFTLVPLPGMRSSLVWVVGSSEAERLRSLPAAQLAEEVEVRAHSILGKVALETEPGIFPLGVETARQVSSRRIALVGEAAHVLPPIGAQGLNLGLRDAATIAELAAAARKAGSDPGSLEVLAQYETSRRADVTIRAVAVDLLNRSLLADFLPIQGIRGLGLYLVDRIGPLRRALMREGVAPALSAPRLMRGEAL
jgi:2-octaprenyl-6-methoxyphenol hydroxylase